MKKIRILYLLILLALISGKIQAQFDPGKVCRLEGDKLIFQLNRNWSDSEKKEISQLFDLDSLLLVKAFEGLPFVSVDSTTWQITILKPGIVEVSKLFVSPPPPEVPYDRFSNFHIDWSLPEPIPLPEAVTFGINSLSKKNVIVQNDNLVTFFLPDYAGAKKVLISGNFNNWSTSESVMSKTDSGWIFQTELQPGKHRYKYIIDGKWKTDPNNKIKEDDGYGNINSIAYVYNHIFRLPGYTSARKVVLCGSFNGWKENELLMNPVNGGWEISVFLGEGTHTYKYIVDRQWINDPSNPNIRSDGKGNINSLMAIGDTLVFRLKGYNNAREVNLAGSFNEWNPRELSMNKDNSGWFLPYVLAKGMYEYKFIVDGQWIQDPGNPYHAGYNPDGNSIVAFKPNHIFELNGYPEAKRVVLSGNFNNWSHDWYPMIKEGGRWIFPIYLSPGKYTYKFIVDGNWIIDPANELWEENEHGTNNSVIWIEP